MKSHISSLLSVRAIFLALTIALCSSNLAAQEFNLDEFVASYKQAMKSLKTISYDMKVEGDKRVFQGSVLIDRGRGYNDHRFLFLGTDLIKEDGRQFRFAYSDNNENFMTLRDSGPSLTEVSSAQVKVYNNFGDAIMSLNPFLLGMIVNGPFTKSTATGKIKPEDEVTFGGFEEAAGVSCVRLDIKTEKGEKSYLVGGEDFLLRQVRTTKGTISYTIRETGMKYAAEQFDLGSAMGLNAEKGGVLSVGTKAPDFALQSLGGEEISLSDFDGQMVVLDFWGTWCKPCVGEIPDLIEMASDLKEMEIPFLSVSCYEKKSNEELSAWINDKGVNYPVLLKGEELAAKLKLDSYPSLVIIDEKGEVWLTKGSNGSHDDLNFGEIVELIKARL